MDATDTPVVVCDAGPLIHLDELDALDDPGEREALLVARARPSAWLLSDDAAARLDAELLGIRAHGKTPPIPSPPLPPDQL